MEALFLSASAYEVVVEAEPMDSEDRGAREEVVVVLMEEGAEGEEVVDLAWSRTLAMI